MTIKDDTQEPEWLADRRTAARGQFDALGLPTRKLEDWKYTSLSAISKADFTAATVAPSEIDPDNSQLPGLDGPHVMFGNGILDRIDGDLPEGVTLLALSRAVNDAPDVLRDGLGAGDEDSLRALNLASFGQGFVLHVAAGVELTRPITIVHATDAAMEGRAAQLRHVVVLGENARATLVEVFVSADGSSVPAWTNLVRDVRVGPGAALHATVLVNEGAGTVHTGHTDVRVDRAGRFGQTALLIGGETVRHEVRTVVDGEGADVDLNGAYLAADGQSFTVFTEMDHRVPHCLSNQLYRGVLGAGSHAAFQGRVIVREGAQKTSANQSNHNLILDRSAEADTKPELEIYADDVKCSHGATVGELDSDMLFYLESRGLDPETARAILVEAFVGEVIEAIENPAIRDHVGELVSHWMKQQGAALS
ncbi:MAG: Fe-S cluster assembly protein SufD [Sphingomonadales bacterium]